MGVDEYESETHHAKYAKIGCYTYNNNNHVAELSALLEKIIANNKKLEV